MTAEGQQTNLRRRTRTSGNAHQSSIHEPAGSGRTANYVPFTWGAAWPAPRRAAHAPLGTGSDEPLPIWLAALIASSCQATVNGEDHAVEWYCISGRAIYTNAGVETELIHPLGVRLKGGHSLAVSWVPGQTEYTLEVFRQFDCCA